MDSDVCCPVKMPTEDAVINMGRTPAVYGVCPDMPDGMPPAAQHASTSPLRLVDRDGQHAPDAGTVGIGRDGLTDLVSMSAEMKFC